MTLKLSCTHIQCENNLVRGKNNIKTLRYIANDVHSNNPALIASLRRHLDWLNGAKGIDPKLSRENFPLYYLPYHNIN